MLISTKQKDTILKGQNEDLKLKIHDNELEVFSSERSFANSLYGCCGAPRLILLFCLGLAASMEINQLQKLQKCAARMMTDSSYNTPGRPFIEVLRMEDC